MNSQVVAILWVLIGSVVWWLLMGFLSWMYVRNSDRNWARFERWWVLLWIACQTPAAIILILILTVGREI